MNEQIKQKLSDLFEYKLKEQINFDDVFSVNVELKDGVDVWVMDADMMAETGGQYANDDYDSPPEYKVPCISCKRERFFFTNHRGLWYNKKQREMVGGGALRPETGRKPSCL